jgi:hypothetical protein
MFATARQFYGRQLRAGAEQRRAAAEAPDVARFDLDVKA